MSFLFISYTEEETAYTNKPTQSFSGEFKLRRVSKASCRRCTKAVDRITPSVQRYKLGRWRETLLEAYLYRNAWEWEIYFGESSASARVLISSEMRQLWMLWVVFSRVWNLLLTEKREYHDAYTGTDLSWNVTCIINWCFGSGVSAKRHLSSDIKD